MIDQFVEVATRQIGTTDAALKQYVAGEHAVFFLAIIHQATGRMSGDMDCFQLGVSESDDISVMQIFPQRNRFFLQLEAEHTALFRSFIDPELIRLIGFCRQTELFQHKRIAEDVIQV